MRVGGDTVATKVYLHTAGVVQDVDFTPDKTVRYTVVVLLQAYVAVALHGGGVALLQLEPYRIEGHMRSSSSNWSRRL